MYRLVDVVRAARAKHGSAERMHACQLSKLASAKQHVETRLAAGSRAGAQKVSVKSTKLLSHHCKPLACTFALLLIPILSSNNLMPINLAYLESHPDESGEIL